MATNQKNPGKRRQIYIKTRLWEAGVRYAEELEQAYGTNVSVSNLLSTGLRKILIEAGKWSDRE